MSLGSNIASAATITPPSTASVFNITGTTTITAIASTNSWDGRIVTLIFAGALTLTHSSNLALPASANITTAANDVATFVQTASGAWRCVNYQSAGVMTLNGAAATTSRGLAMAGTTTAAHYGAISNTGADLWYGVESSVGAVLFTGSLAYSAVFGTTNATAVHLGTNAIARVTVSSVGAMSIAAPSSGHTLTVTHAAGTSTAALVTTDGTVTGAIRTVAATSVDFVAVGAYGLRLGTSDTARLSISSGGNVTVAAPSSGYGLNIPTGTPASAAASGTAGDVAWDASYIYVCTAANTWKRAALSTW